MSQDTIETSQPGIGITFILHPSSMPESSDVLERRRFGLASSIREFAKRVDLRKPSVVILERLKEGAEVEAEACMCYLVGGFLTSVRSVLAAVRDGGQPRGVHFAPAVSKRKLLWVSAGFRSNSRTDLLARALLQALDIPGCKWKLVSTWDGILEAYANHRKEKGVKSKPWFTIRALVDDAEEILLGPRVARYPRLLVSLVGFVREIQVAERSPRHIGYWP